MLGTFRRKFRKAEYCEDKDNRAFAGNFVADMKRLCHGIASECQRLEEFFECQQLEEFFDAIDSKNYLAAPMVTAPLVSLPKPSAQVLSACAELPPVVTNDKEAMRPSNTVPTSATAAAVEQVIGVVEPG